MRNRTLLAGAIALTMLLGGMSCADSEKEKKGAAYSGPLFRLLDAQESGIDFVNEVVADPAFNILTYRNFYNGGGVAIGDVNGDSLPDLYFTANQQPNRLYLNQGKLKFVEVGEAAGVAGTKAWSTGVCMADVNGDGWLDIYVCNSGDLAGADKTNELFINQQDGTFLEQAEQYGLANEGYSTQASFFDYDLDGDLDCYLLNNSFKDPSRIELYQSMRDRPDALGGDKLYRNDDGQFVDVSQAAGIYSSEIGFGLGAAIGDVNQDHWPDIYVSNDFWERDYLYLNQQDGTFSEELIDRLSMCSVSSMGGDIADLNNDGAPEIFSTDMLPGDNYRLKAMTAFDPYHLEDLKYRANYHYQMLQNCLQLNDGQGRFQEIGLLSGVAATDWSWGALMFDFENDGHKDIFVSNGIHKDIMSMDFRDFLADNRLFQMVSQTGKLDDMSVLDKMPSTPLKNAAFHNDGSLVFQYRSDALGFDQPSFSNGAAYGDLDGDGDQDLVINNVNMPAFVYENQAEKREAANFLKIRFEGYAKNPFGIGAQVNIRIGEEQQTLQNFNSRGFESSIEPNLIFGLGGKKSIDELEVIWPDQQRQILTQVSANETLLLRHAEADVPSPGAPTGTKPLFAEMGSEFFAGKAVHQENRYNDFDHEGLLHRMLSTEGPRMLRGDVNQDGREDVLLLGAKDDPDKLFLQTSQDQFRLKNNQAFTETAMFESSCGAFFDHDGDGDLDVMLGAGGNEYERGGKYFILRQYLNDGKGNFRVDNQDIPPIIGNFSCLEATDLEGDGDTDLFLGGRLVPGNYGLPPRSFLFRKENGKWIDTTPPELAGIGMVTDATWVDIDQDGDPDLVVVGDWMAIHLFRNEGGQLLPPETIPNSSGWWNRVEAADLDLDGFPDLVLGNWGLNSKFKASPSQPLSMHVNDFDQNGKSEFLINWYPPLDKRAYPFATKPDLTAQLPSLRKFILKYEDYARMSYDSLFPASVRQQSANYSTQMLESAVLWNEAGQFRLAALPIEAQLAPIFGIAVDDFTQDGIPDIFVAGNFYGLTPQVGRHDASRGLLLAGTAERKFRPLSPAESGLWIQGEVRDAQVVSVGEKSHVLVARNHASLLSFRPKD